MASRHEQEGSPGGTSNHHPDLYEALLSVVMDASRVDLTEEELRLRIEALGPGVVGVAMLVQTLRRRLGLEET